MKFRRSRFSGLLSVAVLALIMLLAPAAQSHPTCCPHQSHTGNNSYPCFGGNPPCSGKPGLCADVGVVNNRIICVCHPLPAPDPDTYFLWFANDLTALGGPPVQNTTLSYQTSISPDSFGQLDRADQTVVQFEPNAAGPGGFLSLSFGSFADPNAVPVTVDQWFFEFPPGLIAGNPSGPSMTALAPGSTPQLVYNSSTNELSASPDEPMLLVLTNDVDTDAPLAVFFFGEVSPGGDVQLLIQSVFSSVPAPLITPVAQSRSVSADAFAQDLGGPLSDTDSDQATDFAPFVRSIFASAEVSGALGTGDAIQNSVIGSDSIVASGQSSATGESFEEDGVANGSGSSAMVVDFKLASVSDYTLVGQLTAFDEGSALVILRDSSGVIFSESADGETPISESGRLLAGEYSLELRADGSAFADFPFASEFAFAEFDVTLQFAALPPVPTLGRSGFAILVFLLACLGLAARARRIATSGVGGPAREI